MKNRGFSLLELMVVVLIIGILVTMSAVSFNNMVGRGRIKGEADQISREVLNARERSIGQGRTIELVFTPNAGNRLVVTINVIDTLVITTVLPAFSACQVGVLPTVNQRVPESSQLAGPPPAAVDFNGGNTCRFQPQGTGTPGAVYFVSLNGRYQYAVGVNANGRVRRWEWSGTAWN